MVVVVVVGLVFAAGEPEVAAPVVVSAVLGIILLALLLTLVLSLLLFPMVLFCGMFYKNDGYPPRARDE